MTREGGWHQSVWGVVRRTVEAAFEDNVPFLASGLSFDLLLTAIPYGALVLAGVGYLVQHQITVRQLELHDVLARFLPAPAGGAGAPFRQVEAMLAGVVQHRARLTLVGLPLFLWFAARLFSGLRIALNEVFDVDEARPWAVAKLTDIGMMLATAALVVANTILVAYSAARASAPERGFALLWLERFGVELTAFAFSTILFYLLFKGLPGRRIHWRTALTAAVFCGLAFEVAKRLYGLYVARFVTLDRFASDANFIAFFLFLLWIYYTAFVFLLGGEIAETYDLVRLRRSQRVGLG